MRRILFFILALLVASPAIATPLSEPMGPAALLFSKLGADFIYCDEGRQFFCDHATQVLAKLPPDAAAQMYRDAQPGCEKGDAAACWQAGLSVVSRVATDRSPAALAKRQIELINATALFKQACNAGSMPGCRELARSYWWKRGAAEDKPQVLALLQRACDGNLASACLDLSELLRESSHGFALDPARGHGLLLKACQLQDPLACLIVANLIENQPKTMTDWHGPAAVPDLYRFACDNDMVQACDRLGEHYEQGAGVAVDDARSAQYYRRSCDLGSAYGCSHFAGKLAAGEGVAIDRATALALYAGACSGYVPACTGQANLLQDGNAGYDALMAAQQIYIKVCASMNDQAVCRRIMDMRARIIAMGKSPGILRPVQVRSGGPLRYPAEAARRKESGISVAHFTVLADGSTTNCTASGATPLLDAATCDQVVSGLHYKPGIDDAGHAVPMQETKSVNWRYVPD